MAKTNMIWSQKAIDEPGGANVLEGRAPIM